MRERNGTMGGFVTLLLLSKALLDDYPDGD